MARLTPNFDEAEFGPRRPGYDAKAMAEQLELLRWALGGKPIRITSGSRSHAENVATGGARNSQHVIGTAVDFVVRGVGPEVVAKVLIDGIKAGVLRAGGVGTYRGHVHWDLRGKLVTWRSNKA